MVEAQWEILSGARAEIERIWDHGADVFTLSRLSRQMPGSEASVDVEALFLWGLGDGKLVRIEVLGVETAEVQEALAAAGLSDSK